MKTPAVRVPASLLLDPALKPSAKMTWLVLRQFHAGPVKPALAVKRSGLTLPTILAALTDLVAAGWCIPDQKKYVAAVKRPAVDAGCANSSAGAPHTDSVHPHADPGHPHADPGHPHADPGHPHADPGHPHADPGHAHADVKVLIPDDLVADDQVGVHGRLLYGLLQLTPAYRNQGGEFTVPALCRLAHASPHTVRRAVRELTQAGWLQVTQVNRMAPVRFTLRNPEATRMQADLNRARWHLANAPFRGEALMREYLSLLVDTNKFEDNATPGFLVNPLTSERMELDRFYPPGVGFEFQGPQHYGATDRFSDENAAKQRSRDYMKMGICVEQGVALVIIRPEDLSLGTMRQKVGSLLPLRDLSDSSPLVGFLESVGRRYRRAARRRKFTTQ